MRHGADMGSHSRGIVILIDKRFLSVADHLFGQSAAVTVVEEVGAAPGRLVERL